MFIVGRDWKLYRPAYIIYYAGSSFDPLGLLYPMVNVTYMIVLLCRSVFERSVPGIPPGADGRGSVQRPAETYADEPLPHQLTARGPQGKY